MSVRRPLAALSAALLTAVGVAATAGTASAAPASPLADYVVVLADDAPQSAALAHARSLGGRIGHTYHHALNGFSVSLPAPAAARLLDLAGVESVQADQVITTAGEIYQPSATWGLDRIDQHGNALDSTYGYTNTGAGVTAYVIDTGIRSTHSELRGRVGTGHNTVTTGKPTTEDCNGHGTHVAGTIGGRTYGVAKGVTLVPVRVLDCQGRGSTSSVIAGIEWIITHHQSQPAVANMSLGGRADAALDQAVRNGIGDGITFAVAAGNDGQDAGNYSPARVEQALTVGATDKGDVRASFSNHGGFVDLFAPGVSITSAWSTSNTATRTINGTSMAAPHVAGVVALYLQSVPAADPLTVTGAILSTSTPDVVTSSGSEANGDLLYTDW